jgi:hypothetical protein
MVRESASVFSRERFEAWSRDYPTKYADLDSVSALIANAFRKSVSGIGVSHGASGGSRMVFVSEILLQQFPPNLLLIGPDHHEANFGGAQCPAATAPSLSWLETARRVRRSANGRRVAWISTGMADADNHGVLDVLATRLTETFQRHAIVLHTGGAAPEDLNGSDLVIVAAHGSLTAEGRYFHVAADEAVLRMTARQLAERIGPAEVVILFICSAGRADPHPLASATVGLPRLLLDRGVRAVLASPWPLHSRVPVQWLPAFLSASRQGDPVIDANFKANQMVRKAMGDQPCHFLAMNVVGDPLVVASA